MNLSGYGRRFHGGIRGAFAIADYGHALAVTIDEARKIARTVQTLKEQGIDPFAGLVEARVKELQKQDTKWRP
jgi:hypothetical protein